ncbi:response regulator [Ruminiclostridium cellobioparum]|uniref:response regulator n=1 Tax=Ruminiclostridium cellobioparum TaxID=29355 RepID=UPI0004821438|nr:response regulator [Ruminiclostridium cellobioparum]
MKILIVDDDITVHNTIKGLIEKNSLDFEISGNAFNGEEAFEMFKEQSPDIIITDMKMPVSDGLTFMSWVNALEHACKIIVLSGYGDFSYTRPAFLLKAVDYLLKPVNEMDLLDILKKTAQSLLREQPAKDTGSRYSSKGLEMVQEEFLSEITYNDIEDENFIIVKANQQKVVLPEGNYSLIAIKLQSTQQCLINSFNGNLNEFYDYIRAFIHERFTFSKTIVFRQFYRVNEFVIIHTASDNDQIRKCLNEIYHSLKKDMNLTVTAGSSGSFEYLDGMFHAYRQASEALKTTKFNNREFFCTYGDSICSNSEEWREINLLMDCIIENKSIYSYQDLLNRLRYVLSDDYVNNLTMGDMAENISWFIDKVNIILRYREKEDNLHEKIHTIIDRVSKHLEQYNIRRAIQYIDELLVLLPSVLEAYSYTEQQFKEEIKKYIDEHYRNVTLTDISSHFFLNKNYFSTLFKTLTSKTFSDYLLEVRVKKAAYLLKNTNMKIYEVSRAVGYDDSRYFSQVFKKVYDLQPTEYRNSGSNL